MRFEELLRDWDKESRGKSLFHDLMRYRVSEILLVGSLYDSFVVESDGFLTEQITGEYSKLNLSTIPRVTSAYTDEDALHRLGEGGCDLVILMVGLDFDRPLRLAQAMRERAPSTPILLLVLNNSSLASMDSSRAEFAAIDRVFVWNGYSKLLVGMIKYVEDRGNLEADLSTGLVRAILIIEDSIRYYSRYLPLVYTVLLRQTQDLIEEESGVETYRLLRARTRPKILLASSYEEAEALYLRFEPAILALITDLRYQHRGLLDPEAGFEFAAMVRSRRPELPVLIQSSEEAVADRALGLGAAFANKASKSLAKELGDFIRRSLGFGDFRFLGPEGELVATAATVAEFARRVAEVPGDCLLRHAARNEFSTWLTARGEYRFAGLLREYRVGDFEGPEDIRAFLLHVLDQVRREKSEGLLPDFDEASYRDESALARLGSGSVGGKGRGLEFLGRLLREEGGLLSPGDWAIGMPRSLFIGIDEFEDYLERNGLWDSSYYEAPSEASRERFASGGFSPGFVERVGRFLRVCRAPLALRSSGLLEDMARLPLAGLYATVFLPNRGGMEERLADFLAALRRVWASLFTDEVRRHLGALGYSLEEERMGVVVQELVGRERGPSFLPLASGLAWSSSPRAEGGEALLALAPGLGGGLSGFGPSLLLPLEGEPSSEPSPPALGRALALRLDRRGPQAPEDLAEIGLGPGGPEAASRVLRRLRSSGLLSAFGRLLAKAARAYRDEVLVEFALDETPLDRRPYMSLLQLRPWHRGSRLAPAPGPGRPLSLSLESPEFFGYLDEGLISHFVIVDSWPASPLALLGLLADLDREAGLRGSRWILFLPSLPAETLRAYEGLAWARLSRLALLVQADSELTRPPQGSHLFCNLLAAGAAWIRCRSHGGRALAEALLAADLARGEPGPACLRLSLARPSGLVFDRGSSALLLG